jgi:polar amino acid transport system substrate-binding protein
MAKEKGFYKEEGLDVNLIEITKNTDVIKKVLNTSATYGVGDGSLVTEIMEGKNIELLMPIYDESAFILVAINLPNIKTLKNILKYNIVLDQFAYKNSAILGMLSSIDDIKKFKFKKENYFDIDKKGVFSIYISNKLYKIKKSKIPYKIFNPKNYGFDFYGDILFTSKKEFENHKDRALKVMYATKMGYIYAFNHIDETIKIIKSKYNTQKFSEDKLRYESNTLKDILSKTFLFDNDRIKQIVTISNILFKLNYHKNIFNNIYSPYRLTKKEQKFINTHTLKCITTINWAPFNTMKNGKISGIAIDYWKYIKKELHLKSECIEVNEWVKVLESIKTKTADLTLSTTNTPERKKICCFYKILCFFSNSDCYKK